MDTYTLLRKGIRKLLKQLGYAAGKQRGLSPENAAPGGPPMSNTTARPGSTGLTPSSGLVELKVLFQDAEAALEMSLEQHG